MRTPSTTIKKLLWIAGITQIMFGIAHFFFPGLFYESEGFKELSSVELDIVTLCIFSVGILLIAVGIISNICALKYELNKELSFWITLTITLLWLLRIIFELIFPVKIVMHFINNPTLIAKPIFLILWIILAATVYLMIKDKQKVDYYE